MRKTGVNEFMLSKLFPIFIAGDNLSLFTFHFLLFKGASGSYGTRGNFEKSGLRFSI